MGDARTQRHSAHPAPLVHWVVTGFFFSLAEPEAHRAAPSHESRLASEISEAPGDDRSAPLATGTGNGTANVHYTRILHHPRPGIYSAVLRSDLWAPPALGTACAQVSERGPHEPALLICRTRNPPTPLIQRTPAPIRLGLTLRLVSETGCERPTHAC